MKTKWRCIVRLEGLVILSSARISALITYPQPSAIVINMDFNIIASKSSTWCLRVAKLWNYVIGCNDISCKFREMASGTVRARGKNSKNRGELSTQQTEVGIGNSELRVYWCVGTRPREYAGNPWLSHRWHICGQDVWERFPKTSASSMLDDTEICTSS